MNDLERDLTSLFHEKAASVDPVPTAPEGVLRRGRRRQIGNLVGGVAGAVAVVVIALLVAGSAAAPPTQVPVGRVDSWTTGGQLKTTVQGAATSATFDAFGTTWRVRDGTRDGTEGVSLEQIGGTPSTTIYQLMNGSGIEVDEPGGTFFLEQTAPDVDRAFVAIDGDGLAQGRWMQTLDNSGRPGRLWVIPVPGAGTGTQHVGNGIPRLVSWPTHRIPQHGDVVMAGSDGVVSWGLRWDAACPIVDVLLPPADAGSGAGTCITAWSQGLPNVDFAAGPKHVLVAVTGPAGMTAARRGPDGSLTMPCYEPPDGLGSWSGTGICVVPLTVGSVYTLDLRDANGRPLGHPLKLTPTPGGLTVG